MLLLLADTRQTTKCVRVHKLLYSTITSPKACLTLSEISSSQRFRVYTRYFYMGIYSQPLGTFLSKVFETIFMDLSTCIIPPHHVYCLGHLMITSACTFVAPECVATPLRYQHIHDIIVLISRHYRCIFILICWKHFAYS
jgi:hypothetical protein